MKESNFYSDEFEQLLREKTEQYKMYPSEKVWKGIHGSLHTKRRWFISGMFLLVTGILFFAGRELLSPSKPELARHSAVITHNPANPAGLSDESSSSPATVSGSRHSATSSRRGGQNTGDPSDDQSFTEINVRLSDPAKSKPDISGMLSQVVSLPAEPPSIPLVTARTIAPAASVMESPAPNTPQPDRSISFTSGAPASATAENSKDNDVPVRIARNNPHSRNTLAATRSSAEPVAGGETLVDSSGKKTGGTVVFTDAIADQQRINWLYDYAVYNMPAAAKRGRKYFQLYLSPTVNYRTLSGELATKSSNLPGMRGSAKDYIDRKPSAGFEMGGMMMYRLTRNLTVKGGLQFNFSHSSMNAFTSNPGRPNPYPSSPYGYALDKASSQVTGNYLPDMTQINLGNDYYQLAAPVGFELRVLGNERLTLNVGATIQPTYLLSKNSYLLTMDYTNYIKDPSLLRRWNMVGSAETFLSYKLHNGLRLQAGPEFHFQLGSTFNSNYPIRENMKGYGLKIGIVKAIP